VSQRAYHKPGGPAGGPAVRIKRYRGTQSGQRRAGGYEELLPRMGPTVAKSGTGLALSRTPRFCQVKPARVKAEAFARTMRYFCPYLAGRVSPRPSGFSARPLVH